MLRSYGYTVIAAASGNDALRILAGYSGTVDLLVTDLVMPGMSGQALAAAVEALRPGTPTLFISGYSEEVASRQGVLDPGIAYLQKPFSPAALAGKIREVLAAAERQ